MVHERIFKALNKAKVKYVVVGGVAVILHGYRRHTDDLDLMVMLEEKNLDKFYDVLIKIGYLPKRPVTKEQFMDEKLREKWKKEKGMIVFSFYEKSSPFQLIDMFVDEPIAFKTVYEQRVKAKIAGLTVPIISISHLKKLKRMAGRTRDLDDIANLEAIQQIQKKRRMK